MIAGSARVGGWPGAWSRASARIARRLAAPEVPGYAMAAALWLFIVGHSAPGTAWATALDARCYWFPSLADPYQLSSWGSQIAYVYSPAFLQLIAPLKALPWPVFVGAWTALLMGALLLLTGWRLLWLGVIVAALELYGGNISLFLALAIVLGFRWPAAWSFVLLTKITPGVGLLWFAVRREWHHLLVALGATAAVIGVSVFVAPRLWVEWLEVLASSAGGGGTWAAVPIPLSMRLPLAILVVVWGARTDRRWTVPLASMLALPALWYGGFSMLIAFIPLASGRGATLLRWLEPEDADELATVRVAIDSARSRDEGAGMAPRPGALQHERALRVDLAR